MRGAGARRYPLVAVEGTDASGKATLTAELARLLSGATGHASSFSFPAYGTATGKLLLEHLRGQWFAAEVRDPWHDPKPTVHAGDMLVRQTLMTINRLEVQPAIEAALLCGPVVLDRWWASSLAYGVVEGLDPAWVHRVSATLLRPDLWLLLDVAPAVSAARRPARDLNEADLGKMARVRAAYQDLFARAGLEGPAPGATIAAERRRWCTLDASQPAHAVHAAAWALVGDLLRDMPRVVARE